MEQVQGWSEAGGTSVVVPGTQGSGSQRFQQSFRGCTVTVRDSSNNLATIYSDDLASPTAKANPFTSSSTTGSWSFFITPGTYSVTFSGGSITAPFSITVNVGLGNAGGVPSYAFASLPTSKSQNAGDIARVTDSIGGLYMDSGVQWVNRFGGMANVKDAPCSARGDGTTDDRAALNTLANTTLSSGGTIFFPSGTYRISSNMTFPAIVTLIFAEDAILSIDVAVVVTIVGPIIAPQSQHFSGSGTVSFAAGKVSEVYPEWWGATADGSTNNATAIGAAYTAAGTANVPLRLLPGIYQFTSALTFNDNVDVIGSGIGSTVLRKSGNFVGLTITSSGSTTISGFEIRGSGGGDTSDGIQINTGGASGLVLRDIHSASHGGNGITILSAALDVFENILCVGNTGDGLRLAPTGGLFANANTFTGLDIRSNGGYGLNVAGGGAGTYSNQFFGVTAQNNTSYGIRINHLTNIVYAYCESNTAGNVLLDTSSIRNFIVLTNSTVTDPATIDNGTNNVVFELSTNRYGIGPLNRPRPGTNVAGRNMSVTGGAAGAGAAGQNGGNLLLYGGLALGSAGAANGGDVYLEGGDPVNGGRKGYIIMQTDGGIEAVLIGLTSPSSASVGLELSSTTRAFLPSRMTDAQRDAMTAVNGMIIYNSTTSKLQVRAGGSWVDLH